MVNEKAVAKTPKVKTPKVQKPKSQFRRWLDRCYQQKSLIAMVIPGLIIVFIFNYIPIYGITIAFQKYNPVKGFFGGQWVGLKYFRQFFNNPYKIRLIRNTLIIGVESLVFGFPASIILALLMDQLRWEGFKRTVQTSSYLPYFLSAVVVNGMIHMFFAVNGPINDIIASQGGDRISFLTTKPYFRPIYILSGIWQGAGWGAIVYLAALANVDPQLHEAAIVDGANRWQRVRHVTWPAIIPTTTIMLIFAVSGILSADTQKILLLYNETTYEVADVIGTYIYREGILGGRFEYTTAIGLMLNVVSFVLLMLANFWSRKVSETSLW